MPGFKGGGPIQSINNLINRLSNDFQFEILTSDRDLGDKFPYNNVRINEWNKLNDSLIFYLQSTKKSYLKILNLLSENKFDLIYFNSFFSLKFTFFPLLLQALKIIPHSPLLLAPRGEFSPNALSIKKFRKFIIITLFKIFKFHKSIFWHVTSKNELKQIKRVFKNNGTFFQIPMLSQFKQKSSIIPKTIKKEENFIKIIFLSRIAKMKNLRGALELLKLANGNIEFNIYGTIENKAYWNECKQIIEQIPKNIKINYCGKVNHENVLETIQEHHILFLPTLGENFGHIILESFSCGIPVLISDLTPWKNLESNGIGWDVPLNDFIKFKEIFDKLAMMNHLEYEKMRTNVQIYYSKKQNHFEKIESKYKNLFNNLMNKGNN